jgi:hypothetical protein
MAFTRDDFLAAITAEVSNQPLVAQLYQAGDPRVIAHMNAMATMLAMISSQIDVESMEPFTKARDTTVLADATLKGILPFARPARVTMTVTNGADTPLSINIGRRLIGPQSRVYVADTAAVVAPGGTSTISAKQLTTRAYSHTVANSTPFYSVQVPPSSDPDLYISGVSVSVAGVAFPYTPEFSNLGPDEPGFALETDEYRALYAKFGWAGTFGVQPSNGTVIDFVIEETGGLAELSANAPFVFETNTSTADQSAKIILAAVSFPGANPVDVAMLRELTRYPSIYDRSAVYLGNFDFLVRSNLGSLRFLSVWNEQIEEKVRGPSITHNNKLFVAALMDNVTTDWLQSEITKYIAAADDSYRIEFVAPVPVELPVTINAQVSVVHDIADTKNKITGALLGLYGADSVAAARGMLSLNRKRIYEEIKRLVPALQDDGSDLEVVLGAQAAPMPEEYRYVSAASITVNVTQATYNDGLWSH